MNETKDVVESISYKDLVKLNRIEIKKLMDLRNTKCGNTNNIYDSLNKQIILMCRQLEYLEVGCKIQR